MPKRTISYESDLHERLRDPEYAVAYLRATLEDDDELSDAAFLLALGHVAKANKIATVAEESGLNRESLYKMFSEAGNPSLSSLKAVLKVLGMKLSVQAAAPTSSAIDLSLTSFGANLVYSPILTMPIGMIPLQWPINAGVLNGAFQNTKSSVLACDQMILALNAESLGRPTGPHPPGLGPAPMRPGSPEFAYAA